MTAGVTRLILSSYLIIFLIGGGRVCGCEALSWIGIHCQKSGLPEESVNCHVHHHTDGEDDFDHSHSDQPESGEDCCEQSLKLINGDIPKYLTLPEISISSQLVLEFNPLLGLVAESLKSWKQLPSHFPDLGHTRLLQQRFNV